ncbi:hypothetical protein PV08_08975 [Exophiala spinifera]|uniref:Xylanolytic transcriptional activator regulatory domain-containing protein n=1 Tax=Exophiala spinifera TaxID=91928 RepID=A0A0D2BRA0_9EURO|nr:uncharacterized protein PV08_08975 [Exophiala spinifera]KIW13784.1 hypothetical protein PV08_08975 [Exophiala spinifera]
MAKERYDYDFHCVLVEPQQTSSGKIGALAVSRRPSLISTISGLGLHDLVQMLSCLRRSNSAPIDLVNMEELKASAAALFQSASDPNPSLGDVDLHTTGIPMDRLALVFAVLANSTFELRDPQICPAFLELSTILCEDYAGESTFDLVVTFLLQHVCVLRTSTSNRARDLIGQAVRAAHELGINRGRGVRNAFHAARLYLLLFFCDLYSAMTYNTPPYIKPDDYDPSVFQPLLQTEPRLRSLLDLLSLNGQIVNKLYNEDYSYEKVMSLEDVIGQVYSRIGKPWDSKWHSEDSFVFRCETLALNHMHWSRILLRSPLLLLKSHWVSSLSICVRSAQTLLSIYFNILGPGIRVMAHAATPPVDNHEGRQLQEATNLPPTWRQVQRITTSALIVIYCFWHGETSYEESGRACAMALLLLEFRRTRWGSTLDDAQRSIRALAGISGIWLRPFLEEMLPRASEECLARVAGDHPSFPFAQPDRSLTIQEARGDRFEQLEWHSALTDPRDQQGQAPSNMNVADGAPAGSSTAPSQDIYDFLLLDLPISSFWNSEGS